MTLNFNKTLQQALDNISQTDYHEFLIHEEESATEHHEVLITKYGDAKWAIVDLLNQKYSQRLEQPFDLINWLHYNENDELAYFLNEVGSNVLNYSEFKAPYKFHLWLGERGFIVGIEQKGKGFDAEKIHHENIKEGEGAAFDFFRKCKGEVFFDVHKEVRVVYFEATI